ncbi:polyprenyl synthetase family protein [Neolewinella antarctica]|uniref:Geranylgeranyl diphosphate synthase type II n=1 Tax=Neolewinella antarctica TaxID=442734 RepID=A0ABX0X8Y8_9BACT|nr:polyprenyl synthetase family protein [Neolewinella antarctica]NJC25734.1 geranylgeranyl diphosphate synthase type II [Neolewinella antarctica]
MLAPSTNSIQELREQFLAQLSSHFREREPLGLYDPINYILQIGGKRIRPVLALLSGKIFGDDDLSQTMSVALAVEVFHNFTLLHDDIMDDSPIRRGQPTVHERWDVNTGILSGDLMLIQAYQHLASCPNVAAFPAMLAAFNRVATGVCEGQQYDVDFESRDDVTIEEYLQMIELKTAVLLGGALEIGALAAGASQQDADHLYAFGRLTGLAFQLQDDLLDTFGESAATGKLTGNDIIRNKKTFLFLHALDLIDQDERIELTRLFTTSPINPANKIARVTAIMEKAGIPAAVAELRDKYQAEAYVHLNAIGGSGQWKKVLGLLTESLLGRES